MLCLPLWIIFLDCALRTTEGVDNPSPSPVPTLAVNQSRYKGYKVLRITPRIRSQVDWLQGFHDDPGLDFWSGSEVMEGTDVMVRPDREESFIRELKQNNMVWEILIPDVETSINEERSQQVLMARSGTGAPISFQKYNRYDDIVSYLFYVSEKYPKVATVRSIGFSTEGRYLPVLIISSGDDNRKPTIIIECGIHAREWMSPAMALYIIYELVENPENADLIEKVDWQIIPLINPDGYEYSHTTSRLWRKTRSASVCSQESDPNHGVDANRNFDFHWMEGTINDTCSSKFGGKEPFSEPETRALRDMVLANKMRAKLYLAFHTYGSYILYPWGYIKHLPTNWPHLEEVAYRANNAQWDKSSYGFTVGSVAKTLSVESGTSIDWVKGVARIPLVYSVELPGGGSRGFDMSPSEILQTVSTFFPAVRTFGEHVANPKYEKPVYQATDHTTTSISLLICCALTAILNIKFLLADVT